MPSALDVFETVRALEVLGPDALEKRGDVFRRGRQVLHAHDALEDRVRVRVLGRDGDDTGTVNEVDTAHEGDVLPDFGFPRDGSDGADFFLFECVDDAGFTSVGVADEADGNLFLVRVEDRELTEELDEGSFTKRIVDRGMEGDCGCGKGKVFHPSSLISKCQPAP